MASFNNDLADLFVRHAVNLERFKGGQRRKALQFLKKLENDLAAELARQDPRQHVRTFYQEQRLQSLLQTVRTTIRTAYKGFHQEQLSDLRTLAQLELDFAASTVNDLAGVELLTVGVSSQELRAIVSDVLISGAPQKEWWARQAAATERTFADIVRRGIYAGRTTGQITSELRGIGAFDGSLRRGIESLVRTSVTAVSTAARQELFAQNDDVIQGVQQRSVLDGRTTQVCIAYSGMSWSLPDYEPLDGGLPWNGGPPRHFGCRSTIVPLLKAFAQLDVGRKKGPQTVGAYFERQGASEAEIERAQASMDGVVPADLTYEQWLSGKPVSFQQSVLGMGKWKLWSEGKLTFSQLVNENGRPLTLAELRQTFGGAA